MKPTSSLARLLGHALVWLPPLLVCLLWTVLATSLVDAREQAIEPVTGGGLAPFVQLAWAWNAGLGWVQTVRWESVQAWWWDQHWGPLFVPIAWLSGLSDSPWALPRLQVLLVGLGSLGAWWLGWAEARLWGGWAALLLYASSAPLLLIATADFQLLALTIPLLPVAVWAARHASLPVFAAALLPLAAVREEALLLLPIVGLCGGLHRALLGAGVAGGWALLLHAWAGFFTGRSALALVLSESWRQASPALLPGIDWAHYAGFCGGALPWMPGAPALALGAWAVAAFQYLPGTELISNPGWRFVHHLAPLVGLSLCAAILTVGRLMRALPWGRPLLLLAVGASCAVALARVERPMAEPLHLEPPVEPHPAWALLDQVPDDAVLLVPHRVAPAAARRRWLVMPQSLGYHIQPEQVTHLLDDGASIQRELRPQQSWEREGTLLAELDVWTLVELEAP